MYLCIRWCLHFDAPCPTTHNVVIIMAMLNGCPECLVKQQKIDKLTEELTRLRQQLSVKKRKEHEGPFGSSTPSSQIPNKPNTDQKKTKKKKGAKIGHKGHGRQSSSCDHADQTVFVPSDVGDICPECAEVLRHHGHKQRTVIDSEPVKAKTIVYLLEKKRCTRCKKIFQPLPPSVLPKCLYGNQLIATATTMHYLHGIPMGRICSQTGLKDGALVDIFHRIAALFSDIPSRLIEEYRRSPVKHADETGWRTDGRRGYAWLFATPTISIFKFTATRSGSVPRAVFGNQKLPGVLVVDRYNAYNKMPCAIQYCYSHLLREVQDLEKEFPDEQEVQTFGATVGPLIALAMKLRTQDSVDAVFLEKANEVKEKLQEAMNGPAVHMGIRRIQDIFVDNGARMYHWADDRRVPAENNLAERDLRPTVIARKTSFCSHSDAGAKTRSTLMTITQTLKKQGYDVSARLKRVLDVLAKDPKRNTYDLLFGPDPPK